jgi:glycosyltransferase involved in cell wall biosynthesis
MKVLIATTYIYKKEWPEFTRNRTGFGIMVNDIFESVSEEIDTYLLSQVITEGHGKVLKHTWGDVFGNARPKDWGKGFKYFFGYQQGVKSRIKYFYYALNSGNIRKTIKTIKPDVVHIQGIGAQIKPFIDVCEEEKVPYIVTLHGLIGLDDTVQAAAWDKQMEREFLIEADKKGIPVTVISTGMKRRIEKNYLGHEATNITVVCNGTRIPFVEKLINVEQIDLRKEYGLTDEKIIVAIGSLCERKNQIQIVKAMKLVKTPCHLFLCGGDASNGAIQKAVEDAGLNDRIHMLGFLPHEKADQVLDQADLNIVASKDEGFGFSIIEAYSHGVPTVTFADLAVVPDLFDERAMIKVEERNDEALAEGIENGLNTVWDREFIKHRANHFSLEDISKKYMTEYQQALATGGPNELLPISKSIDFIKIQKELGYSVLSFVGNISDNKNQMELVRLMEKIKGEKVIAVLVGREMDENRVRRYVFDNGLSDRVFLLGFCSEMDSIWESTDLNVFFSKNDGFGLPVIEGYMRGIPAVMNNELDAYQDVGIESALIGASLGKTEQEYESIHNALQSNFDREQIMRHGSRYSLREIAKQYLSCYKEVTQ